MWLTTYYHWVGVWIDVAVQLKDWISCNFLFPIEINVENIVSNSSLNEETNLI